MDWLQRSVVGHRGCISGWGQQRHDRYYSAVQITQKVHYTISGLTNASQALMIYVSGTKDSSSKRGLGLGGRLDVTRVTSGSIAVPNGATTLASIRSKQKSPASNPESGGPVALATWRKLATLPI